MILQTQAPFRLAQLSMNPTHHEEDILMESRHRFPSPQNADEASRNYNLVKAEHQARRKAMPLNFR